jgi:hypothetical protein
LPQRLKLAQRSIPDADTLPVICQGMKWSRALRWWAAVDGGEVISEAGALLLGGDRSSDRLVTRFAACFDDRRDPATSG